MGESGHSFLRRALSPPVLDNEDQAGMAWMLHYILLFMLALNVPTQINAALLLPTYAGRAAVMIVSFTALALLLLGINKRGSPLAASRLFILVFWFVFTYAASSTGGLQSPAILGQLLIVSTAAALLGWRWGLSTLALGAATVSVLGIAEYFGALPQPSVAHTTFTRLTFLVFYLLTIGFEWMLILVALRRSKERIEAEVHERRAAEQTVRALNAELEARVAARTAELRQAVSDLEASNARLDTATKAKSQLVTNMSHELRTPLNSIIGFSTLLRQQLSGPLNEEQQRQLGTIRDAGQRLLELVNQVLDLSSIESAEATVASQEFDIVELTRHVGEILQPLAAEKGISVGLNGSPPALVVRADRARTEQVLLNLVGNAIKFTERGSIVIGVASDSSHVEISVRDTGIGVGQDDHESIFERFYQAVPPAGGKYEGSGLGLPVARELARLMGGDIVLDCSSNEGSTFVLRLPRKS